MTTIRELKKDSKIRLSGNYIKLVFIYLVYSIIVFAFSCVTDYINFSLLKFIYAVLILIFSIPLSYGVIDSVMDIIRGKKVPFTDFINIGLKNIGKVWKVYLRIILKLIIPIIILIASAFFVIITLIGNLFGAFIGNYFILSCVIFFFASVVLMILNIYYSFAFYILKDKPEKTAKEIVNLSRDLMKGNVIKYIGLILSFLGWYILILILGLIAAYIIPVIIANACVEIGFLMLFPYISATLIGFYEDIYYDKTNASEKE